ncbi:hypothetical protein HK101_003728 [Irineochytrium annulatum]|nr:hypothetical protein HK101_003728 [Irineochytrium annulatum]
MASLNDIFDDFVKADATPAVDWSWLDAMQIPTPSVREVEAAAIASPTACASYNSYRSDLDGRLRALLTELEIYNRSAMPSPICVSASADHHHSGIPHAPTPCIYTNCDHHNKPDSGTPPLVFHSPAMTTLSSSSPFSLLLSAPPSPDYFKDMISLAAMDVGSPASFTDLAAFHSPQSSPQQRLSSPLALDNVSNIPPIDATTLQHFQQPTRNWSTAFDALLPSSASPTPVIQSSIPAPDVRLATASTNPATPKTRPSDVARAQRPPTKRTPSTSSTSLSTSPSSACSVSTNLNSPFPCPHCPKQLRSPSSLRHHLRLHTNPPKRHACPVCGRAFIRRQDMLRHGSVHLEPESWTFRCKGCARGFRRRDAYVGHLKNGCCGVDPGDVERELESAGTEMDI